jgi:hypothetical protein
MPASGSDVQRDLYQLKRKMGLHPMEPLMKCSGKSYAKARNLDYKLGYKHHRKPRHHCRECACCLVAGNGTDHYGYGLCHIHERKIPKHKRIEEAEKHLRAIRERNPFTMRKADKVLENWKHTAKKAKIQVDLTRELETARGLVSEIVQKCKGDEKGRARLVEVVDELINDPEHIDSAAVLAELITIRGLLQEDTEQKTLTEYVNGIECRMSDKTRLELSSKLLYNVSRLGLSQWTVNRHEVITKEEWHIWLSKVGGAIRKRIIDDKEWSEFCLDMKDIGEPRSKSV